ncbi:MAG: hypothetical protein JW867_02865 [Candidatus Omnitrophica bacterium]|nr:hypothetical protein [Candidatus Omnitrophota bacterium]
MQKSLPIIGVVCLGISLLGFSAYAQEHSGGYCGDGTCESSENLSGSYCPADCCGDGICSDYEASAGICPADCCGDGKVTGGENCSNCPEDAGECPYCGDGTCSAEAGENCSNCSSDCGECLVCGDGTCSTEIGEDCTNCTIDCGTCPDDDDEDFVGCGDGVCNNGEDCNSCVSDCGVCQNDDDDDDDADDETGIIPEEDNPDEYDSELLNKINEKFGIEGRDPTLDGVIFCDPSNC